MANKYIGHRSCYAYNEGAWVARDADWLWDKLMGVLALILRDLGRGWSYGDNCEHISFTWDHAYARGRYAGALASAGKPEHTRRQIMDTIESIFNAGRIPPGYTIRLEGPRAGEIAEDLVRLGIVSRNQVRTPVSALYA